MFSFSSIGLLITRTGQLFRRFKVESLTRGQQAIIDGASFEANWVESAVPIGTSVYAEFTVPSGYAMVLSSRTMNPSTDNLIYRVYPSGTYTIGTAKTDTATAFFRMRNRRRGSSAFTPATAIRSNVSVLPAATAFIVYEPQYGTVNAGNRAVNAPVIDSEIYVLDSATEQKFLLEARNNGSTSPMDFQIKLYFYLVANDDLQPAVYP